MAGICVNLNIGNSVGGGNENSNISEANGFSSGEYKGNWNYNGDGGNRLSDYDNYFKKAGKALNLDWRLVATHSYIESSWKTEAKAKTTSAGGLYQFIDSTWKGHAPKGYEATSNKYDPDKATDAYIHLMSKLLNQFSNASTRNDQILLAFQSYHDGTISGTTWANVNGNKYTNTNEGRRYVPKIMERYAKFGGSTS